jgi:tetratricopeptide (TPR) repeat protein
MSKQVEAEITCPICSNEFPVKLYRSLWVEFPENMQMVLTDEVNAVTCPECRTKTKLEFPFLCTNVKKGIAVWYEPYHDPEIDKDTSKYAAQFGKDSFYAKAPRIKNWTEFKSTLNRMESSAGKSFIGAATEQDQVDRAIELMKEGRFGEALPLLRGVVGQDPSQWNAWYMAGQCCRFLNDFDGAIEHLTRATELTTDQPAVFSALGIALQQQSRWGEAVNALRRAIEIDPDYELAYNSLALTQKMSGELDKALDNYEAGVKALTRRIVKVMRNDRASPILKHRDTTGTLWVEHASYGAIYLISNVDGIDSMAWPTGVEAVEEERTEKHGGLYWIDTPIKEKGTVRLFLPNYFNKFRESLRADSTYANFTGNQGSVLELLGRGDEATQYFDEANEFLPQMR